MTSTVQHELAGRSSGDDFRRCPFASGCALILGQRISHLRYSPPPNLAQICPLQLDKTPRPPTAAAYLGDPLCLTREPHRPTYLAAVHRASAPSTPSPRPASSPARSSCDANPSNPPVAAPSPPRRRAEDPPGFAPDSSRVTSAQVLHASPPPPRCSHVALRRAPFPPSPAGPSVGPA